MPPVPDNASRSASSVLFLVPQLDRPQAAKLKGVFGRVATFTDVRVKRGLDQRYERRSSTKSARQN